MLEDQVAFLLQKYLGNYVKGLSAEALKISVWKGDVELKNMQLKPEALNALKLPVRVKAGFLGSVRLKVPWSKLGQEPVQVYLDSIFVLAEPATTVETSSEDAVQEMKKRTVQELERKLLEARQQQKSEVNASWLGSLINTIIGNLKLSINNIHIRYEDVESNPGHPFACGVTLEKLSAITVDDNGVETFVTGGALDHVLKSVNLQRLALYFDPDTPPWSIQKPWGELLPSEWSKVFEFGSDDASAHSKYSQSHSYLLEPVSGVGNYAKFRPDKMREPNQPLQRSIINLEDVILSLSKDGYRDILKMADNFSAFNKRLSYAHYRPTVNIKSNPKIWWRYAYKVVSEQSKKASGRLSWDQVLRYTRLRKHYITLYASLLKSETSHPIVVHNKDIDELDRELDVEVILQWRMLAHKFVEQTSESNVQQKQQEKKPWWSLWNTQSVNNGNSAPTFSQEDWRQLNQIIGYKDDGDMHSVVQQEKGLQALFEVHMKRNATKLLDENQKSLAELSCDGLCCSAKLYGETKVFDVKLGAYRLCSPNGLLAESDEKESLLGIFTHLPFDSEFEWSLIARASPCYITYLKDSVDQIISFFTSSTDISQSIALEAASAMQLTIDEVKRSAQQQLNRTLKDHTRFLLDLDIAAPKITIPSEFFPDNHHATKLLLDLGNFTLYSQDDYGSGHIEDDIYLKFKMGLKDISAFLVDGDYSWSGRRLNGSPQRSNMNILPVLDKCGVFIELQQIWSEHPSYPSSRLSMRVPSLGFHFSPARYHRLMKVMSLFLGAKTDVSLESNRPWNLADFEGWVSVLSWKGVGNREAVWKRRYTCLVGPFIYLLGSPDSKSYKQCTSLRGKQIYHVPLEYVGGEENVIAISDTGVPNSKVVEQGNSLVMRFDNDDLRKTWHNRLQGAIYRTSAPASLQTLSEENDIRFSSSKDMEIPSKSSLKHEKLFVVGILDELKINVSSSNEAKQGFKKLLLTEERSLFKFVATGGQVELSIKANDMFIGTVLRSLDIEDLYGDDVHRTPRYLAKSFIENMERSTSGECEKEEGDTFYEATESLDSSDYHLQSPVSKSRSHSAFLLPSSSSFKDPPSFSDVMGLVPEEDPNSKHSSSTPPDSFDNFVKAEIIIYDVNSPFYDNIDKKITVSLATLLFFCNRPTILALLDFMNAINMEDNDGENKQRSDNESFLRETHEDPDDHPKYQDQKIEESKVKGVLGRGKSRIIFSLTLNMALARILLMKEDGTQFASLFQNNLHTGIQVFPSSFSLKVTLGNLKISDDSLAQSHAYFWVCDMRDPDGSSFVEIDFSSFSTGDDDYEGYDYSLVGRLSEVRIVYLNRFVQEVVSYFSALVPSNSVNFVKLKDHVTNSEMTFTLSEIEGSPSLKLDLSLQKPIILMPRRTDSLEHLELDVLNIRVSNTFCWCYGEKNEIAAVHLEILTVEIKEINIAVWYGTVAGESILKDIKGLAVVIRRSLRDLLHQFPAADVSIKVDELIAAVSSREYQIISECAVSNISEAPHSIPPIRHDQEKLTTDSIEEDATGAPLVSRLPTQNKEIITTLKFSVSIRLAELCLHSGSSRDATLATFQVNSASLLYKSTSEGDGYLYVTIKGFSVIDDRDGTAQEFKLAIGRPEGLEWFRTDHSGNSEGQVITQSYHKGSGTSSGKGHVVTMLVLDMKFQQALTTVSLCIQKPQMLVALDFLLVLVEFFVPNIISGLLDEENVNPLDASGAIILDQPIFSQTQEEFSLSPKRPLVVDDDRFETFIYDGNGGYLTLQDGDGNNISYPQPIIYVGSGKILQFRNITIQNGEYLNSCIVLGSNSNYSISRDDGVHLMKGSSEAMFDGASVREASKSAVKSDSYHMEYIVELQAIGPELTFCNISKDVSDTSAFPTKLLHAELDLFSRINLKDDFIEIVANAHGFTMESNGVRIVEPFDTSLAFSNIQGKIHTNITVSDIILNFSFSVLQLFLGVQEDVLTFLRMTSRKNTIECSKFDRIGVLDGGKSGQAYAFWRPCAPPGFAVLGDCLTPLNEPPTKGVMAVNTNFMRVKRPVSFQLVWSSLSADVHIRSDAIRSSSCGNEDIKPVLDANENENILSIWFPVAPPGYIAMGCVVSSGREAPPVSSVLCIISKLVSPCGLKDCINISFMDLNVPSQAFWRVDNSIGSFLPADPTSMRISRKACDLRSMLFAKLCEHYGPPKSDLQNDLKHDNIDYVQEDRASFISSGRRFERIAHFHLVWWNKGNSSRKKISIWRPIVPEGIVFLGDVAIDGFEAPNSVTSLHDDETLSKHPIDFHPVGHIKSQRKIGSISFWYPQAPPGYIALGCVASKTKPKLEDFHALRCVRADMVTGGQFAEESIWNSSGLKHSLEPFSLWKLDPELGTFLARAGFKKPPKRFAMKLVTSNASPQLDNINVGAEIRSFSVALSDDYGGMMIPLFNISFSDISSTVRGSMSILDMAVSFSSVWKSYSDKHDLWEPFLEPMDGFVRYSCDTSDLHTPSQLRVTSTSNLNLNISVSNINLILQALSSWSNLTQVHESYRSKSVVQRDLPGLFDGRYILEVHHRRNYYIIPSNKLGQDIFLRASESGGISNPIRLSSGNEVDLRFPISKNTLATQMKRDSLGNTMHMIAVVIGDAELPCNDDLNTHEYMVEVRILLEASQREQMMHHQKARTCCATAQSTVAGYAFVNWGEIFLFKFESLSSCILELTVTDAGKGQAIGFCSMPLSQMVSLLEEVPISAGLDERLSLVHLESGKNLPGVCKGSSSKIRFGAFFISSKESETRKGTIPDDIKPGFIQISPNEDGPWTTVRLNYAAPVACWRLGDHVVASEVNVMDGDRHVTVRSLVTVSNDTSFDVELFLVAQTSDAMIEPINSQVINPIDQEEVITEEVFETEVYELHIGWVSEGCKSRLLSNQQKDFNLYDQTMPHVDLPEGWQWVDDWHVDKAAEETSDGWTYSSDMEHLGSSTSFEPSKTGKHTRQRRLIRNRRRLSIGATRRVSAGLLKPKQSTPLPLLGLRSVGSSYILQIQPKNHIDSCKYSCSFLAERLVKSEDSFKPDEISLSHFSVSSLNEGDYMLHCPCATGNPSGDVKGLWFCLSVRAMEIGKDIHSDPIQDWNLVIQAPLSISSFLPLPAEVSVLEEKLGGLLVTRSHGIVNSGGNIDVYNADMHCPLYLSVLPQGGWKPINELAVISHPVKGPSKKFGLKSSISGRSVDLILEQSHGMDQNHQTVPKTIRIFAPYWIECLRCPALKYRLIRCSAKTGFGRRKGLIKDIVAEFTDEEMVEGCTIDSTINFRNMGLSVALRAHDEELFGPVTDLSSLGEVDGWIDLKAYDSDQNCFRIFLSAKPCPYQAVPTKVINFRPYLGFTNLIGEEMYIKLSDGDEPKVLHASDSVVSFAYHDSGDSEKLQVRLEDTRWSFPVEINKEDIITIVLRGHSVRRFLRAEIRGYEGGSRFLIVFRLCSMNGPIRIENRTNEKVISLRQSGLGDDSWFSLGPLSTANFSWENPYGQKILDVKVQYKEKLFVDKFSLDSTKNSISVSESPECVQLLVLGTGDERIARFIDCSSTNENGLLENQELSYYANNGGDLPVQTNVDNTPWEIIVEFGVLGISLIDHRPRELLYFYLERVFFSHSSGYDGGTSRFKLILGYLQIDNQLPLSMMPVLLAPEHLANSQHSAFKMTITVCSNRTDGIEVYPYFYVRVTEKYWRINIHEPIIWALVDLYKNVCLDRLPQGDNTATVDPEIRVELIDISEVKLKLSLEPDPAQRPPGVLGIWSPILSAVGNAFKIQVHLRKVVHQNKFMRRSLVIDAIRNRIWRDLVHNPLHLIFSVDVLGMASSTLATLSKGFAELSTDGQFLQLRSKQTWTRKITGVSDGIVKGTEALAQGVAFGVSGVVTKPVEHAREHGVLGFVQGVGQAVLGAVAQPLSGALDFFSLTVDGVSASCANFVEAFGEKATFQRVRNPRVFHANGLLTEYSEKEALGQMILHFAEASKHFGCTEILKEPSKYAWSDTYEEHFSLPHQRILLITNKRVLLLQCFSLEKPNKKPCKILWDVPWEELLALELAKGGFSRPTQLIVHLKNFRRSQSFVRVVKCEPNEDESETESSAVKICLTIRRMWKSCQNDVKSLPLRVPSSKKHVYLPCNEADCEKSDNQPKAVTWKSGAIPVNPEHKERLKRTLNFRKIWTSELDLNCQFVLCRKGAEEDDICSIWSPICPAGYVSVGHIARSGTEAPIVAAVYQNVKNIFALPIGYDLVWRNCIDDYATPVSIWFPRPPNGYVSLGCVVVPGFAEPERSSVSCAITSVVEETEFEGRNVWRAENSYPWACYVYQVRSDALQFIALRKPREELKWKALRISDRKLQELVED